MLLFYIFNFISIACAVNLGIQFGSSPLNAGLLTLGLYFGIFFALLLLYAVVLFVSIMLVDLKKERKCRSRWIGFLVDQFLAIVLDFARVRIHTKGLEMVPRDQPFLLVSNHIYDLDPVLFMRVMPWAKLGFIAKKEVYDMFLVNRAMHALHCLPVDRENDRSALKTIIRTAQILKTGEHSMAVFPEGYESKSGVLLPFRNGVFKIAQRAEVPIVVAVTRGNRKITKNMFRRRTNVSIEILGVVPVEEHKGVLTQEVGDRIHVMMAEALKKEAAV